MKNLTLMTIPNMRMIFRSRLYPKLGYVVIGHCAIRDDTDLVYKLDGRAVAKQPDTLQPFCNIYLSDGSGKAHPQMNVRLSGAAAVSPPIY